MPTTAIGHSVTALVEVCHVAYSPEYYLQGRPHTRPKLYLDSGAARRLHLAREHLKSLSTPTRSYDVLVWDGFRCQGTQENIFEEYKAALMRDRGLDDLGAQKAALTFVSDPASVFPHGTGGTIDLTLTVNGEPAEMGTGFDDFSERAHRDWYLKNPPSDETSEEAHRNRVTLQRAMEGAGFVGLKDEWWHFEWGTARWAKTLTRETLLIMTLQYPPIHESQNTDQARLLL